MTLTNYILRYELVPVSKVITDDDLLDAKKPRVEVRTFQNDASFTELQQSILEKGVLQPIVVQPKYLKEGAYFHPGLQESPAGNYFIVRAGRRRLEAVRQLSTTGKETIPAVVISGNLSEKEVFAIDAATNYHMKKMSASDWLRAIKRLQELGVKSQKSISAALNVSPAWVSETLKADRTRLPGETTESALKKVKSNYANKPQGIPITKETTHIPFKCPLCHTEYDIWIGNDSQVKYNEMLE